ncbi:hypothetical protein H312_03465 [Anncaliia algerae PRA339]|uniref:Uncharacterized protein n=1 Tax=Anncaliia algerae PRA339 TaxID=1288291 RepID=A0A059EWR9_9MICR|nr:hypothetical protein H312_03465 [Anncaliia algerae PRA339]
MICFIFLKNFLSSSSTNPQTSHMISSEVNFDLDYHDKNHTIQQIKYFEEEEFCLRISKLKLCPIKNDQNHEYNTYQIYPAYFKNPTIDSASIKKNFEANYINQKKEDDSSFGGIFHINMNDENRRLAEYKDYNINPESEASRFEMKYPLDFISENILNINDVISSDEFTEYLINIVHAHQKKKLDFKLYTYPQFSTKIIRSDLAAARNALYCIEFISVLKFRNLRDFIYYFATMMLFTIDFRICFWKVIAEDVKYSVNFFEKKIIPIGRNILKYGFRKRTFGVPDLYITKEYMNKHIFNKVYSFNDFVNFIFNSYTDLDFYKMQKRDNFDAIFRYVYSEIYIFFKSYVEKNKNIA